MILDKDITIPANGSLYMFPVGIDFNEVVDYYYYDKALQGHLSNDEKTHLVMEFISLKLEYIKKKHCE